MKNYYKNKESSSIRIISYWNVNNLYGWAMYQKLPTFNFH